MKLMVVGGGGREHVIIKKLKENPKVAHIYALPGNGGIAKDAECVDIKATDKDAIVDFAAANKVDFVVVTPDDPLVLGTVDALKKAGIASFGPDAKAAEIEGSKVFSKYLMKKYGIPTAAFEVFDEPRKALLYLQTAKFPIVIKADGLALGKGVIIAEGLKEAQAAVTKIMQEKAFGKSGNRIVIEEFLEGPEVSVLAFTDGKTMAPMVSSMDHKRALDGDKGLNTGGMGTVAPNPFYEKNTADWCMQEIFLPTMHAMNKEGRPFKGCLYFGLMLTKDGPKVIEYNCRFGDPEAQVVLPLLKTDLLTVLEAVEAETLREIEVEFEDSAACCVIVASGGYPQAYKKAVPIEIGDIGPYGAAIYHAGTALLQDKLVTSGGRVLGVTATGQTLKEAIDKVYGAVKKVSFEGAFYRHDIGKRALLEK
jgi:phosphoribosylamine--glycine ligase